MAECDRCGEEVDLTRVLRHVIFDKEPISRMVGTYTVCSDCYSEMDDDPDITW